jgi:hypothetical protein
MKYIDSKYSGNEVDKLLVCLDNKSISGGSLLVCYCLYWQGLHLWSYIKMCERPLHADEIYNIMFFLSTEDVLRCMQVCKYWKVSTSNIYHG